MTAKAVCLRIKVAQLKSFGWKNTGILQYLEVFYILFEAEKQGFFLTRRFESGARGDRNLFA